MRRAARSWSPVAAASLVMAGACSTEPPKSDPVEIGVVASLSGDVGTLGSDIVDAMGLAVAEINRGGGVLGGRMLRLNVADDATTLDGARAAYDSLLKADMPVILGPLFSGGVAAIEPAIKQGGTLTISPSASSPALSTLDDGGFFYRTIPSDTVQGVVLAQLVVAAQRKSLCVVYRDDAYGRGLTDVTVDELVKTSPTTTLVRAKFDPASGDLSKVLDPCDALKDAPDSGIAFVTFVSDGASLLDDAARRGWAPPRHRFFGVDGNSDPTLRTLVSSPALLEGMTGTAPFAPDPSTPEGERLRQFEARFQEKLGKPAVGVAANAYDAMYVAALALELAGTDKDRGAIVRAMGALSTGPVVEPDPAGKAVSAARGLKSVDYRGATGNVDFDPTTGDLAPPYYIAVWAFTGGTLTRQRVVTVGR